MGSSHLLWVRAPQSTPDQPAATSVWSSAYVSPRSASATSDAGGVKRSPYVAASSRARSTNPAGPPSYPLMYCSTPPDQAGKPIPKIEPMLASATDSITPSSTHLTLSIDSMNIIRSSRSRSAICDGSSTVGHRSRRPFHRPVRLPASSYS